MRVRIVVVVGVFHCSAFQLAVCVLYAPIIIIYRQSCQIKLDVFPIFFQMMQKQQDANRVIDDPFKQVATVAQYTPDLACLMAVVNTWLLAIAIRLPLQLNSAKIAHIFLHELPEFFWR